MSATLDQQPDLWDGLEETFLEPPAAAGSSAPSSVVLQPVAPQSSVEIADSASGPRLVVKCYSSDAREAMAMALTLYAESRRQLGLDDSPSLRLADRRA
jgi:hypothetical protein